MGEVGQGRRGIGGFLGNWPKCEGENRLFSYLGG